MAEWFDRGLGLVGSPPHDRLPSSGPQRAADHDGGTAARRALRHLRRRPGLVLIVLGLGLVLLFPGLRREDVRFEIAGPAGCGAMAEVEIFEGPKLARGFKLRLPILGSIAHAVPLAAGSYRVEARLACEGGHDGALWARRVEVERSGTVFIELGADCPCGSRSRISP